jgi:hypothetical protein
MRTTSEAAAITAVFVVADEVADQYHLRPPVALGLGRVADRLDVALVEMLEAGELNARRVAGSTARLEVVGDLNNGRHRFAHLAEKLQTDGARDRRHLVQHPAGGDDDAVGAFLLDAGNAAEKLVGDILAQPVLAAAGAGMVRISSPSSFLPLGSKALEAELDVSCSWILPKL